MEGCLSFPGKQGYVVRPNHVRVQAYDRNGDLYEYEGEELLPAPYSMKMTTLTGLYIPVSLPIRRRATRKRSLSIQSQRTIRRKKNRCA